MLRICKEFFLALNEQGVRYCHWKSNVHLDKALNGETDLDLLILPKDKESFCSILEQNDIMEIVSPPEKCFPGMGDYLGFDYETGKFIHLHVHYKLVLGQKYIKNHHLPLERVIFENLIQKREVCIPCPEMELILLIIRAHMKTDMLSLIKHGIKDLAGQKYTAFPADIEIEFSKLINDSNIDKLLEILRQCSLPIKDKIFTAFIAKFSKDELRCFDIASVQWQVLQGLKDYRRQKSIVIVFQYFYFFLINSFLFRTIIRPRKKKVVGQGKIISLVGADGSGKSTLIGELEKWLSWKLEVRKYYYGIPKAIKLKIFSYFIRILQKCRLRAACSVAENFLWLFIARKRLHIANKSRHDTQRGMIVITDRFPLKEFQGMPEPMDGSRISKCVSSPIPYFAKEEERCYAKIPLPDKIFVLQVSIEELRCRKTDLDWGTHKIKADAVNSIKGGRPIVLIDANRPYNDVELDVKRQIWLELYEKC